MNYKKNILIAEDDQDTMRYLMKGILGRRRMLYDTFVCTDGHEALETMDTRKIDCLILDLNMLNLNGIQVLQEMHKNGMMERIKVIVSSGFIDESMELQLKNLGVTHYLKKPYTLEALLEQLDSLLVPQVAFKS